MIKYFKQRHYAEFVLVLMTLIILSSEMAFAAAAETANTDSMAALRDAIKNSNYPEAYKSALVIKDSYEGDPEYDFLYGLASLETGEYNEAVFALERVVSYFPDKLRARLELGRAYYATQNFAAAEKEFKFVLENNPPENVKKNIKPFLERIEINQNAAMSSFQGYLGLSGGYDNNINSATNANEPMESKLGFGQFILIDESKQIDDKYSEFVTGISYLHPFSKRTGLSFKLDGSSRNNFSTETYDISSYSAEAAYHHSVGKSRLSYGLRYQSMTLASENFQHGSHLNIGWQRPVNPNLQITSNLLLSNIAYPDGSEKDVYQALAILGTSINLFGVNNNFGFLYGNSNTKDSAEEFNGRDFYGFSYAAMMSMGQSQLVYARVMSQFSKYDAENALFGKVREDETISTALGWQWLIFQGLTFKSELGYTKNDSNIEIYQFDRTTIDFGIRYQF